MTYQNLALEANTPFPIVGIGASAGGLKAYSALLRELPTDTGMAFVIVQHLSPDSASMLSEILARATTLPVTEITHGLAVQPDHLYVMPSDVQVTLSGRQLQLVPRNTVQGKFMPVDAFFQSLADEHGDWAIAVVLSGLDGDGAAGLERVKRAGGITFAQSEATAEYAGMPSTAIETGAVDFIFSPAGIAQELANIAQHPYLDSASNLLASRKASEESEPENPSVKADLSPIYLLLRAITGVDFAQYKRATFERRLRRRMALNKSYSVSDYTEYLRSNPAEVKALYHDVLISVTSFFRDADAFDYLQSTVLPTLIERKALDSSIRLWIAGCATGEECYSLAICLLESLSAQNINISVQIFGTDVSEAAIETARRGIYSDSRMADVSPERRRQFFHPTDGGYKVSKAVRDLCVFARQNLGGDPPFSNIDLVSCRNVLIYFAPTLQRRILSVFHYSLNPGGFLWLGNAESVRESAELFTALLDQTHRVYSRNSATSRANLDVVANHYRELESLSSVEQTVPETPDSSNMQRQVDQIVLNQYAPVGVVVNEQLEILHVRGDTSPYLRLAPGALSFSLLDMLQPGLTAAVREAIEQAKVQGIPVRREDLQIDSALQYIHVRVTPIRNPVSRDRLYLVLFEEGALAASELAEEDNQDQPPGMQRLQRKLATTEQELLDTQAYLQATIEAQEATNQRLTTASEEVLSSNEELQSTNEELQTAKEEIQAANEELKTTNEELKIRNTDEQIVVDDLLNLINNVSIPIVMLTDDLRIRRFTPTAQRLFNLIPTDVGRPISNIRLDIEVPNLESMITEVINTLNPQEQEIKDSEDHWYWLRIRPYRTAENRIDGAVITLVEIDNIKRTLRHLEVSRLYIESIVETVREPLVVLTADLTVRTANRVFCETFQCSPAETRGQPFFDLKQGQWDIPEMRLCLENRLPTDANIRDFEINHTFVGIGPKVLRLNACEIKQSIEGRLFLLSIEDLTERQQAETERLLLLREQAARTEAEAANTQKDEFLSMLSHELRTPLNAILGWISILQHQKEMNPTLLNRALPIIRRNTQAQAQIINDLLEISRIIQGQLSIKPRAVNLTHLMNSVIDSMLPIAEQKEIQFFTYLADSPAPLMLDSDRMQQVFLNALSNAIKFTPETGQIDIRLIYTNNYAQITVTDTGDGISPEFLPYVFDRFRQENSSNTRQYGGLGLGLAIVKTLVEGHGGTVQVDSPGIGQGTTLMIALPLTVATTVPEESFPALPIEDNLLEDLRILVVEDNVDNLEILVMTLEMQGATVTTAMSVTEARRKFTDETYPDLLISDISLPDEDGFALIRWVRSLPATEGGEVMAIAVTGYAAAGDAEKISAAGFQRYLTKPVALIELLTAVVSLVE